MATVSSFGAKHTCLGCNARFYDLNKRPAACPKCNQVCAPIVKAPPRRRIRAAAGENPLDRRDALIRHVATAKPSKAKPKS